MESVPQFLVTPAPSSPGHSYFCLEGTSASEMHTSPGHSAKLRDFYNFETNVKMGIVY